MNWPRVCQKNELVWFFVGFLVWGFSCQSGVAGFDWLFQSLNQRIADIQNHTMLLQSNKHRTLLYHEIGRQIVMVQLKEGWGAKVIDRLAQMLQECFPRVSGFSIRNLNYMRKFACAYQSLEREPEILRLPWFHIVILLDKVADEAHRRFYAQQAIANNWSRRMMVSAIEKQLHLNDRFSKVSLKENLGSTEDPKAALPGFKGAHVSLYKLLILPLASVFEVFADLLGLKSLLLWRRLCRYRPF